MNLQEVTTGKVPGGSNNEEVQQDPFPVRQRCPRDGVSVTALGSTSGAATNHNPGHKASSGSHCATANGVKVSDQDVCKGLRYYKGKTISFVAGGLPGGSFDALARVIAPELQLYLGTTVNVTNIASSATAQDSVEAATSNGLTIGELNAVPDAVGTATNQPVVNFNPAKTNMIGASGANADMFTVTKSSPFQSFRDLVKNTSTSNPVQELALSSGYDTTVQLLLNAAFGIHAHIITGYVNEASLVAGFNRGDGEWMLGPLTSTGPLISGGRGDTIALTRPAPAGTTYASALSAVPVIKDLEKKFPPKTTEEKTAMAALNAFIPAGAQVLFTAHGVPGYLVKTLVSALYWSVRQPQEKQAALLRNLTPGWQSPTTMRKTYNTMLKLAPKLALVFTNF